MSCYFPSRPGVAELADAADSKSAGALLCVGSTPSSGTKNLLLVGVAAGTNNAFGASNEQSY